MSRKMLFPILALAVILSVWELVVTLRWVSPFILPAPSAVLACLGKDAVELGRALAVTAFSVLAGFLLSAVVGMSLGIFFFTFEWLHLALYPYTLFFQTVPIIAIAPLLVIWFGYGVPAVVASAFIVSVFPVIASTLSGLVSADPALKDLFRLYRATRWQALRKLYLPNALPYLINGLRISGGLAVIGAIVGEFLGGVGVGSIIDVARAQQRLDKVFAAVFLASLLGLALIRGLDAVGYVLLRNWHPSESSKS